MLIPETMPAAAMRAPRARPCTLAPLLKAGVLACITACCAVAGAQPAAVPASTPAPGLFLSGSQGPLVVLQAGLGDDHRGWARLVADLARDHRVLALDRPGYGGQPASAQPRDPCTQAEEARQRLQAAGLAPPYLLVGHSLGGRYAAVQALRHPQETRGLVLVDATPPGHWPRMQAETPGLATMLKALRATVFDATSRREFDDQDGCMDTLGATAAAAAASAPAASAASAASATPAAAGASAAGASAASGATTASGASGAAAAPAVPALPAVVLASGRRRPEETPEFAALLARGQALWPPLVGAAGVEVAHDAGHYIQRDAPDRVAAAVRRISGLPDPAAPAAAAAPGADDDTLPDALRKGLQRLQPGSSTRQQAQQALGDPTERQTHADAEVWIYNPRKSLPPLVGWLPVLGDVLEVAEMAHQRMRRHELILQFDTTGVLRRRTVRALDS